MLIWSAGTRVVPFTFVPVSARVPACQQSARDVGLYRPSPVAVQLDVWTLSLAVRIRMGVGCRPVRRCLSSAEGRARHPRPRGSEESENVQVRRVETTGNRRKTWRFLDLL